MRHGVKRGCAGEVTRGRVRMIANSGAFGFINADGDSIFFHRSAIVGRPPQVGEAVEVTTEAADPARAFKVKVLSE